MRGETPATPTQAPPAPDRPPEEPPTLPAAIPSGTPAATERALTEDERLEYQTIGELYRHDDTLIYQSASTFFPLAFGAVAVAAQFPGLRVALAVFSVVLYLYWLLLSARMSWYTAVRLHRAQELESIAGLKMYRWMKDPPEPFNSLLVNRYRIRSLRWIFLIVLVFSWLVLFVVTGAEMDVRKAA